MSGPFSKCERCGKRIARAGFCGSCQQLVDLIAKVKEQGVEIKRLRAEVKCLRTMIEQTADGVLVPDCKTLFCPECAGELRLEHDCAYCDSCSNPDGYDQPPLPLLFSQCYSTRGAVWAKNPATRPGDTAPC